MKVLVALKRTLEVQARVALDADGMNLDPRGGRMVINPFDEIALEAGVRLREAGVASEVLAVSCGDAALDEHLRMALALGADRALRVECGSLLEPLAVARLLKAVVLREAPDLVLMGKQAVDSDAGQTPQMLAAMLGWPQAIFASQLQCEGERVQVSREIDHGSETLMLSLPAVVSCDLRLNTPRYAGLPALMRARRQPLEVLDAATLGLDLAPRLQREGLRLAAARAPGRRVDSPEALAAEIARLQEWGA